MTSPDDQNALSSTRQPRSFIISAWVVAFAVLEYVVQKIAESRDVATVMAISIALIVLFFVAFAFVLALALTHRWVMTDTGFGFQNIAFKTVYPFARMKRVYLARVPTDPRVIGAASAMGEIVSGGFVARGMKALPFSTTVIGTLARRMAPEQLWLDLDDGQGGVRSRVLATFEKNTKILHKAQLATILRQVAERLPADAVDPSVWSALEGTPHAPPGS